MKKHVYSICTLLALFFIYSCVTVIPLSKTTKTYEVTKKPSENIVVSYKLPIIKPTSTTNQMQTKGGVTITVEIVPIKVKRVITENTIVGFQDPSMPGYDVFETSNTPEYKTKSDNKNNPDDIIFKIKIRNNEAVPLKLSEIGFALIIDGTQWSFPTEEIEMWNKGFVLTGFEKEYYIRGPQLEGLYNAQVVYLFLNGVPVSYNEGGYVTKKSNFEWYFECKSEEVEKQEEKTYTYTTKLFETKQCTKCNGSGKKPQAYKCTSCDGSGRIVAGKTYTCSKCNGTGIIYERCENCKGDGKLAYPKSVLPRETSSITWSGAVVQVVTNPPGAKVSIVNTNTKEYSSAGMSNLSVNWYSSNQTSYPIVIENQGQKVKVLPYNSNGQLISKVIVDFSTGTPLVTKGQKVN